MLVVINLGAVAGEDARNMHDEGIFSVPDDFEEAATEAPAEALEVAAPVEADTAPVDDGLHDEGIFSVPDDYEEPAAADPLEVDPPAVAPVEVIADHSPIENDDQMEVVYTNSADDDAAAAVVPGDDDPVTVGTESPLEGDEAAQAAADYVSPLSVDNDAGTESPLLAKSSPLVGDEAAQAAEAEAAAAADAAAEEDYEAGGQVDYVDASQIPDQMPEAFRTFPGDDGDDEQPELDDYDAPVEDDGDEDYDAPVEDAAPVDDGLHTEGIFSVPDDYEEPAADDYEEPVAGDYEEPAAEPAQEEEQPTTDLAPEEPEVSEPEETEEANPLLGMDVLLVTAAPTSFAPTQKPTEAPTIEPTMAVIMVTAAPTSFAPTADPTREPTPKPTRRPTRKPTNRPTEHPTHRPSQATIIVTASPTSLAPTARPSMTPTLKPSITCVSHFACSTVNGCETDDNCLMTCNKCVTFKGDEVPCFCDLSLGCQWINNIDGVLVCEDGDPTHKCAANADVMSFDDDYDDDLAAQSHTFAQTGFDVTLTQAAQVEVAARGGKGAPFSRAAVIAGVVVAVCAAVMAVTMSVLVRRKREQWVVTAEATGAVTGVTVGGEVTPTFHTML
jgi:hypothetical protein